MRVIYCQCRNIPQFLKEWGCLALDFFVALISATVGEFTRWSVVIMLSSPSAIVIVAVFPVTTNGISCWSIVIALFAYVYEYIKKCEGRFVLHFIPIHSSWLNMVERWLAEITNKRIRRESWESVYRYVLKQGEKIFLKFCRQ